MFVRWQKRKRGKPAFGSHGRDIRDRIARRSFFRSRASTNEQDVHWAAILVERVRGDGRSRLHHVAYLGGITDSAIETAYQRAFFWRRVTQHLDRLASQMSSDERKRIEQAIAEKVPRLTRQEYDECYAGWIGLETDRFKLDKPSFESCGTDG